MIINQKLDNTLKKSLKAINVSAKANRAFRFLYFYKDLKVEELAKKLNIARPNTYKILKELESLNLIKKVGKSKYITVSPRVLLEKIKEKKQKYEDVDQDISLNLPELLKQYKHNILPSRIKTFYGKKEYAEAMKHMFVGRNTEICFFGSLNDFITLATEEKYKKLVNQRIKQNIKLKTLILPSTNNDKAPKTSKKELREVKFLKNTPIFNSSFQVSIDSVLFWQPNIPMAILIEDRNIALMMKIIFDKLWE